MWARILLEPNSVLVQVSLSIKKRDESDVRLPGEGKGGIINQSYCWSTLTVHAIKYSDKEAN